MGKQNWFDTLSDALDAEGLAHMWDNGAIRYAETRAITYQDGTRYGHYMSVYRSDSGRYERPIHYGRG